MSAAAVWTVHPSAPAQYLVEVDGQLWAMGAGAHWSTRRPIPGLRGRPGHLPVDYPSARIIAATFGAPPPAEVA